MVQSESSRPPIRWSLDPGNPVIPPGRINGELDARHAGAAHVLERDGRYLMHYWAIGADGRRRICAAESAPEAPNQWRGLGSVLEPQPETDHNCDGPSFPFVVPVDAGPWLMYFCAWGRPRESGRLPNSTGLALSHDGGETWAYHCDHPVIPLDRPWDREGTGSVCVVQAGAEYRMYYTAIGEYFARPEGVQTGHGNVIPRIGVGYAVSRDGIHWGKPMDALMISPRGFDTDPYEYICSKPFIVREKTGYRMWAHTFGTAYRIRSLTSADGLRWEWVPSGPDGDLGVGPPGAFDDRQRCYACVVRHGNEYRMWYTGNGFGKTGMGYAVGTMEG